MEGVFGQFESRVISRFCGRWPNDSMIFGDSKGSPECRRVAFSDLPKEGRVLAVGGKYSEVIAARVITGTQGGDERTEGCGERGARLYTRRKRDEPSFRTRRRHPHPLLCYKSTKLNLPPVVIKASIFSHSALPDKLSHAYTDPSPLRLTAQPKQNHFHISLGPQTKQDYNVDNRISA